MCLSRHSYLRTNEKEILKFKPKQIFDEDVVKYDKFMIMHDKLIHERYDNTKII